MKLRTRIILGFLMVILVPMLLLSAALYGFRETQQRNAQKEQMVQESDYDIVISEAGASKSGIQIITKDLLVTALIILVFTSFSVGLWIYRSVAMPLVKLRKATQNIKDGNLDFVMDAEGTDEFLACLEAWRRMEVKKVAARITDVETTIKNRTNLSE